MRLGTETSAVRAALAEARSILERLGARPYLERLDELESGAAQAEGVQTAPTVAAG